MRNFVYILIFLFCPLVLLASDNKQAKFEQAVKNIVSAYTHKNDTLLNQYIEPNLGIYFIIKNNSQKFWRHRSHICLQKECINTFNLPNPYSQILLEQKLEISSFTFKYQNVTSPIAEADKSIYIDHQDLHNLTNTIRRSKQQLDVNISNAELQKIWKIESNSKRVIVAKVGKDFGDENFIFYLTYLNNNWYLSIIDFNT